MLVPNNMNAGNQHRVIDMPWLIAGSCGGYFKTGCLLRSDNAPSSRVLVGICDALGVSSEGWADPAYGGELAGMRG